MTSYYLHYASRNESTEEIIETKTVTTHFTVASSKALSALHLPCFVCKVTGWTWRAQTRALVSFEIALEMHHCINYNFHIKIENIEDQGSIRYKPNKTLNTAI